MRGLLAVIGLLLVGMAYLPAAAHAELYLRGNAGWLDVKGGRYHGVGDLYQGGGGGSVELGFGLSRSLMLSGEFGPGHKQPRRALENTKDIDGGSFSLFLGNLIFRMEPVDEVRPYLFLGGGITAFHYDYADTGKVFRAGTPRQVRLTEDSLKGWSLVGGLGIESPLVRPLLWGIRGRYFRNFWPVFSDKMIFYPGATGDAYSFEATLKIKI